MGIFQRATQRPRMLLTDTIQSRAAVVSTITSNYLETIQCKELLRKTAKTFQFMTRRYFKNELKHSKRFDHVTDDVMSLFWSCSLPP